MEKQGRSGILFRCFKEHTKIGLDICAGTCYNIVRKCGHRTSASISAFQAEEVGSIPIARSIKKSLDSLKSRLFSFAITHYLTHFCFFGVLSARLYLDMPALFFRRQRCALFVVVPMPVNVAQLQKASSAVTGFFIRGSMAAGALKALVFLAVSPQLPVVNNKGLFAVRAGQMHFQLILRSFSRIVK